MRLMRAVQSYRLPSEADGMERRAAFKRIQEHVAGEEGRCSGGWISCQQEEEAGGRGAGEEAGGRGAEEEVGGRAGGRAEEAAGGRSKATRGGV